MASPSEEQLLLGRLAECSEDIAFLAIAAARKKRCLTEVETLERQQQQLATGEPVKYMPRLEEPKAIVPAVRIVQLSQEEWYEPLLHPAQLDQYKKSITACNEFVAETATRCNRNRDLIANRESTPDSKFVHHNHLVNRAELHSESHSNPQLGEMYSNARKLLEELWGSTHTLHVEREAFANEHHYPETFENYSRVYHEICHLSDVRARKGAILRAIEVREQWLKRLQRLAEGYNAASRRSTLDTIANAILALRRVTCHIARSVSEWRSAAEPVFQWNGDNYMTKMQNDLYPLANTIVPQLCGCSVENNPLLLTPAVREEYSPKRVEATIMMHEGNATKQEVPISIVSIVTPNKRSAHLKTPPPRRESPVQWSPWGMAVSPERPATPTIRLEGGRFSQYFAFGSTSEPAPPLTPDQPEQLLSLRKRTRYKPSLRTPEVKVNPSLPPPSPIPEHVREMRAKLVGRTWHVPSPTALLSHVDLSDDLIVGMDKYEYPVEEESSMDTNVTLVGPTGRPRSAKRLNPQAKGSERLTTSPLPPVYRPTSRQALHADPPPALSSGLVLVEGWTSNKEMVECERIIMGESEVSLRLRREKRRMKLASLESKSVHQLRSDTLSALHRAAQRSKHPEGDPEGGGLAHLQSDVERELRVQNAYHVVEDVECESTGSLRQDSESLDDDWAFMLGGI